MRKAYSKTGASYLYSFAAFEEDLRGAKSVTVVYHNSPDQSGDHLRSMNWEELERFFDKADSVDFGDVRGGMVIYAGTNILAAKS